MTVLWIVLTMLAVLAAICLLRAVHCRKTARKLVGSHREVPQEECLRHAQALQKMLQCRTVSVRGSYDDTEFAKLRDVVRELFPLVHSHMEYRTFSDDCWMYKLKGKDESRNIMLMSHHDVVDVTDEWTKDPFAGEISEGAIWGRGVLDTKGSLYAEFAALEALLAEGYEPPCNVWLGSSHNEEPGGDGIPKALEYFKEQGITFETIVDEGGAIIPAVIGGMCCEKTAAVSVHEKGRLYLNCSAEAASSHASLTAADRHSPTERMAAFVREVTDNRIYVKRLNPQVRGMFTHLAPYCSFPMTVLFSNLWLFGGLLKTVMPKLNPQAGSMVGTFVSCNQFEGTLTRSTATLWVRYVSEEDREKDHATIRRIAEKYGIALEIDPKSEYHGPADMTKPQFAYLKDCIAAVYPQYPSMPFILPAGTDARTLTEICPCVLRFAPMRMNKQQYASIHGADENMDLDALVLCVDFYKIFLEKYQ